MIFNYFHCSMVIKRQNILLIFKTELGKLGLCSSDIATFCTHHIQSDIKFALWA